MRNKQLSSLILIPLIAILASTANGSGNPTVDIYLQSFDREEGKVNLGYHVNASGESIFVVGFLNEEAREIDFPLNLIRYP